MSRLFILNVVLLLGIAAAALKLNELLAETAHREDMVRSSAPQLPKARTAPSIPQPERTVAASYIEIAQKLLFSRDRSPVVVIATAPVRQVPPFPLAYGVLMIADPPIVMLAAQKNAPQRGYRPGDQIGDFKIVSFDSRNITFQWEDQQLVKRLEDLADREAKARALQEAAAAAAAPAGSNGGGGGGAPAGGSAPANGSKVLGNNSAKQGEMGVDIGGDMRACDAADASPAGTVQNGYRKVISATPFGKVCRWELIK